MNGLAAKKCIPCQGGILPMKEEKAREILRGADKWELIENAKKLRREFKFRDFREAMEFVNSVAQIAESEGHHPDIAVSYNIVTLTLFTHKINGLHENDFILAAKIDGVK